MKSPWLHATILVFLSNVLLSQQTYRDTSTTIAYKWKAADFEYPNEKAKSDALKRNQFIPNNIAILDVDYYAKRYFVSAPQFRNGTPASLMEVTSKGELRPFPNWPSSNKASSCQGPFSVYRIYIDKCGLLWVLDTGRGEIFTTATFVCQPKLLVYDLNNRDREVLHYEFPKGVYTDRSILISVITESYRSDCSDSFAYISDVNDHGMIVLDTAKKTSWRIENKWFYPYPSESTINTNGVTFEVMDGLFGLALGPPTDNPRKLYFHAFASLRESWVPTSVLRNQSTVRDAVVQRTAFVSSPGQRAGQSTAEVMTDDGILIYPLITMNAIACWNSRKPFTIENQHILERDNENFQFISGMKLKDNKLYMMSSRLQNYIVGNTGGSDYKYRIIVIEDVKRLLQNTPCSEGSGGDYVTHHSTESYNSGSHYGNGDYLCRGSNCDNVHYPTPPSTQSSGVVFKPRPRPPVHAKEYSKEESSGYGYFRIGSGDANDPAGLNDLSEYNETTTTPSRSAHHSKSEDVSSNYNLSAKRPLYYY